MKESTKEEIKQFLKEHLRIEVNGGGFTNPNRREIVITLDGEKVCSDHFDVVQKDEYEG